MGQSTNSIVAFICANDESEWAQQFLEPIQVPTEGSALGHKTKGVPGAGFWEHEENMLVPIAGCTVEDDGRVIILTTDFYGLISPARMDLPASLQAVACQSWSCQSEPQDPIFAVKAENIRSHDFSDENPVVKSCWFGLEKKESEAWRLEEEEVIDSETVYVLINQLNELRENRLRILIKEVKQRDDLNTPFLDNQDQASFLEYLKSTGSEDIDPEEWLTEYDGTPIPPRLEYSNAEVIGLKAEMPTVEDLAKAPDLKEKIEASREEAKQREKARLKELEKYAPAKTGLSREEYAEAFKQAVAGAEDTTGAVNAIRLNKHLSDRDLKKLCGYVLGRIESPTSPVGQKLIDAESGEMVKSLIDGILIKGRWKDFDLGDLTEEESAEKANDQLDETFYTALGESYLDDIFADAETFKSRILENIKAIASNFCEENEYEETGSEPAWLIKALFKAGAVFADADEDSEEQETKSSSGFAGKHICVTGKLSKTRKEIEQLIKDAGGIVASGVSKNTDVLVVGKDAGSKLDKARELGITVFNEEDFMSAANVAASIEEEDLEDEYDDEEKKDLLTEHFNEVVDPDSIGYAIKRFVWNEGWSDDAVAVLQEIYSDNTADLPFEITEEAYVEAAKEFAVGQIAGGYLDVKGEHFNFDSFLVNDFDQSIEEDLKMMIEIVKRHPDNPNLIRCFTEFVFNTTECGIGIDNIELALKEPVWSFVKDHIEPGFLQGAFYSGGKDRNVINLEDWPGESGQLLSQPEVIEVFAKHGFTIRRN